MCASWQILRQDKEILLLPLISGVCCLLVLATFALPLILTGYWRTAMANPGGNGAIIAYTALFLFYCCNYFVIIYFQAAIVACASLRINGENPTVGDGLRAAGARLPLIIGWAVLSATVGLILRIIEDRSEKFGQIVAGLLGIGWSLASFLVIPILVIEGKGPIAAFKESTLLLKKTWCEQLLGNFSFGGVFMLLGIPAILLIVAGIMAGSKVVLFACLALAVLYWLALSAIQSALQAIYLTALYYYARNGQVADGFDSGMLAGAMGRSN